MLNDHHMMALNSKDEKEKDSVSNELPPLSSTNVGLTSRTSKAVVSGSNGPTPVDGSSSTGAAVCLSIGDDENMYEEDDKTAKKKRLPSSSSSSSIVHRLLRLIQKVPYSSKILHTIQKLPKSCRYFLLIAWLIWKVVMTVVFLKLLVNSWYRKRPVSRLASSTLSATKTVSATTTFRILHIVTALADFDKRPLLGDNYEKVDRLANILVPVLSTVVQSLVDANPNWVVDVYLILGFELSEQRYNYIRQHLPPGVGLQVWDDAIPLGYDDGRPRKQHLVLPITRTLARQHRFVIRVRKHMNSTVLLPSIYLFFSFSIHVAHLPFNTYLLSYSSIRIN